MSATFLCNSISSILNFLGIVCDNSFSCVPRATSLPIYCFAVRPFEVGRRLQYFHKPADATDVIISSDKGNVIVGYPRQSLYVH